MKRVSWSVANESGTKWVSLPWGIDPVAVPQASFVSEQSFEASGVQLDLEATVAGEKTTVPTVLDFSCPELSMKYCVD